MAVVVVTDHVFPDLEQERGILAAAGHDLRYEGNAATVDDVRRLTAHADAVLNCYAPVPADVVGAMRNCRIIARYGIGLDTIDIDAATEHGVLVSNVPDYCIDEVSDHALALLLALGRGIARLNGSVRAGEWNPMAARPLHRLGGRTLGLVGFGRIARRLAEKVAPIGMRIVATDPYVPADVIEAVGVGVVDLPTLLSVSDVVSIHAPMSEENRHLVGAAELARMREGAFLVNTSRGPLVDLDALRDALRDGRLGGAALDVLETEPPNPGDPLLHRGDVIVTPHAAFYSEEAMVEQQRKAAEQVVLALRGETPPYAVNARALDSRAR